MQNTPLLEFSKIFLLFLFLGLTSCTHTAQIQDLQSQLETAESKISALEDDSTRWLVHVVYFKMKPGSSDADQTALIDAIKRLKAIEVLHDLEVGTFQDLGDKRAMNDYEVVMQMKFKSSADYEVYQAHSLHLALKEVAKDLLGGPPVTYDYWTR